MFSVPHQCRVTGGVMPSTPMDGNNGLFIVKLDGSLMARCIASDGLGWEHVSVSLARKQTKQYRPLHRCPTWEEMCQVRVEFWDEADVVLQFHPSQSEHINYYEYCLHLWRPAGVNVTTPNSILVGPKA